MEVDETFLIYNGDTWLHIKELTIRECIFGTIKISSGEYRLVKLIF